VQNSSGQKIVKNPLAFAKKVLWLPDYWNSVIQKPHELWFAMPVMRTLLQSYITCDVNQFILHPEL
jgi:hypothetical protein